MRNNIGYVPQDIFLFSDTIKNTNSFNADNQEKNSNNLVSKAAKDACIYSDIEKFPKQFDTILGERGITLSGGQKQRISIARALYRNPKILILDDCLSAVDTETEEKIISNLKLIMKNKTSIIVSHRVSSIKHADEIIFLENGKIIEKGTHQELLEKNGYYKSLYDKQLLEEKA